MASLNKYKTIYFVPNMVDLSFLYLFKHRDAQSLIVYFSKFEKNLKVLNLVVKFCFSNIKLFLKNSKN